MFFSASYVNDEISCLPLEARTNLVLLRDGMQSIVGSFRRTVDTLIRRSNEWTKGAKGEFPKSLTSMHRDICLFLDSVPVWGDDFDARKQRPLSVVHKAAKERLGEDLISHAVDTFIHKCWSAMMRTSMKNRKYVASTFHVFFAELDLALMTIRKEGVLPRCLSWRLPTSNSHMPILASKEGNEFDDTETFLRLSSDFRFVVREYLSRLSGEQAASFGKACMRKGFHVHSIS